MSDGQDSDLILDLKVDDVIRKVRNCALSHRQVCGHSRHERTGTRQRENLVDCGVNRVEELEAEMLSMFLVPPASVLVFRVGFRLEPNAPGISTCEGRSREG